MATAYTNYLGSGKRIGQFALVTDFAVGSRDPNYLVDGNTTSSSFWFDAQDVAGKSLEFMIVGSPRVVDAFKIYKQSSTGTQSFKFQGYDGSAWTDLHTFNWPTASGATEFTFTNTTAYRRYRFLGVSGNITTASLYEVEFSTDAASAYEIGDRSSIITVTSSGFTNGGGTDVQALVNGGEANNTTDSWYPNNGQAVSGSSIIKFALAAAQKFVAAKIRTNSSGSGDNGTWKWQGSNDDSTWTDVSRPFLWDFRASANVEGETNGFCYFDIPASYAYYRLIGVSGLTSNSPWYNEVTFDAGTAPDWPANANVAHEAAHVLTGGPDSTLQVAHEAAHVLTQGPGSIAKVTSVTVHVLTSLKPAGEISGDTNAGVHNDITEFGGDDGPPPPLVLESHYVDEGEYTADINISVGNPFKLKFTDDSEYRAVMTRYLTAHYTDEDGFHAEIGSLPPPPLQMFMFVSGR